MTSSHMTTVVFLSQPSVHDDVTPVRHDIIEIEGAVRASLNTHILQIVGLLRRGTIEPWDQ